MKIGTIINNHWASKENPKKYFIYMGTQGKYATGVYLNSDGRLKRTRFYTSDIKDSTNFEVVGYCDAFEIMKSDLRAIRSDSLLYL
jgi:hypothetical protein